jgi:hypothetical protein
MKWKRKKALTEQAQAGRQQRTQAPNRTEKKIQTVPEAQGHHPLQIQVQDPNNKVFAARAELTASPYKYTYQELTSTVSLLVWNC